MKVFRDLTWCLFVAVAVFLLAGCATAAGLVDEPGERICVVYVSAIRTAMLQMPEATQEDWDALDAYAARMGCV